MSKQVICVGQEMDVHEFAGLLIEKNISGAPVVDKDGNFLGIALEEGLMYQDKKVHLPTFFNLFLGFFTLEAGRFKEEMKKIAAIKVAEIMETDDVTVPSETLVEDMATMMIEKGRYYYAVLKKGKIAGVVTKRDIIRFIAKKND